MRGGWCTNVMRKQGGWRGWDRGVSWATVSQQQPVQMSAESVASFQARSLSGLCNMDGSLLGRCLWRCLRCLSAGWGSSPCTSVLRPLLRKTPARQPLTSTDSWNALAWSKAAWPMEPSITKITWLGLTAAPKRAPKLQ